MLYIKLKIIRLDILYSQSGYNRVESTGKGSSVPYATYSKLAVILRWSMPYKEENCGSHGDRVLRSHTPNWPLK